MKCFLCIAHKLHSYSAGPIHQSVCPEVSVWELLDMINSDTMNIFRQYIPKKRKRFGIKIYKLCDESGYTYDMRVYLGKDSHSATDDMTATHTTVTHLTCRIEGLGHKIFMDNFFSSPKLFDDRQIYNKFRWHGTAQQKRYALWLWTKKLKLYRGDIRVKTRESLNALVWKNRCEVYMLTWTHH